MGRVGSTPEADGSPLSTSQAPPPDAERDLLARLRDGDEAAFAGLVNEWSGLMLHLATIRTPSRAVAEEVVQETWLAVLEQLDRFEGRSSLKTWVMQILVNRAISRAVRERRSVPFSALSAEETQAEDPAVPPERFLGAGHRWAGHWASPPSSWAELPEERLLSAETRTVVERAIDALPPAQRAVILLRDVDGWSGPETRAALELTEANQRVLLHRARAKVRLALEAYLERAPARPAAG
jgi:RNA polymerase sigma-70 factor, ECF subfamily